MGWLVYFGLVSIVLSVLYLFFPDMLKRINDLGRIHVINLDFLREKNLVIGILFLIVGVLLIYMSITIR